MFKYLQNDKLVPFYILCKIVRKSSVFKDKLPYPNRYMFILRKLTWKHRRKYFVYVRNKYFMGGFFRSMHFNLIFIHSQCLIISCEKYYTFFFIHFRFSFFYLENLLDRLLCKWMIGKLLVPCLIPLFVNAYNSYKHFLDLN